MFGRKYLEPNPKLLESIFFKSLAANMDFRIKINDLVKTMITQIENLLHPMVEMDVEYLLDEAKLKIRHEEYDLRRQEEIYRNLTKRLARLKGPGKVTRKRGKGNKRNGSSRRNGSKRNGSKRSSSTNKNRGGKRGKKILRSKRK